MSHKKTDEKSSKFLQTSTSPVTVGKRSDLNVVLS